MVTCLTRSMPESHDIRGDLASHHRWALKWSRLRRWVEEEALAARGVFWVNSVGREEHTVIVARWRFTFVF